MSSHMCDHYELGLLAKLVKALPLERQPKMVRAMSSVAVGEALARANIASVSYSYPIRGVAAANEVSGPALLDEDVIKLAGASAPCFSRALAPHDHLVGDALRPELRALCVTAEYAAAHAKYVGHQAGDHPGWKESVTRQVCQTVERDGNRLPEALKAVRLDKEPSQWGFSEAVRAKLGAEILSEALASERIGAEGEYALVRARLQHPVYGYCIVARDGSRGPLGVVSDPKHCADITVRMNDSRDPAVNGPYRMVELRAIPAHEHPPCGRDEHTLGYGIVSAECSLTVTEDGRTAGELICDGLTEVLEAVRLRNVDATGTRAGTKGPWSAVELRAAPLEARRVREFARPDVADLDVVTARGKVLGLRKTETPHIAGTLVGVAHKLRALAIREDDGLLTTLVAPDGNSLANFRGLFGKGSPGAPAGIELEEITAAVRSRTGERIEVQMMSPTIALSTLGGSIYEGRAPAPPIPWESVNTMRIGAGNHFMGEVVAVHHFLETKRDDGRPYTAAVEMRLGHPLLRRAEYSPEPVLLVADMKPARWQRSTGDLTEFSNAKPGDVIDVQMDVAGKNLALRAVARELGADGAVRFAGQETAAPFHVYPHARDRGHGVIGKGGVREDVVTDRAPCAAREPGAAPEQGEDEDIGR